MWQPASDDKMDRHNLNNNYVSLKSIACDAININCFKMLLNIGLSVEERHATERTSF